MVPNPSLTQQREKVAAARRTTLQADDCKTLHADGLGVGGARHLPKKYTCVSCSNFGGYAMLTHSRLRGRT